MLSYLNQITASVLDGSLNFHEFRKKITVLLLGSRNEMTKHKAINIQTVLQKCSGQYGFIEKFYADLSECAHPNHEGLIMGYSRSDRENFANHWTSMYSKTHEQVWLVKNDTELEATKGARLHSITLLVIYGRFRQWCSSVTV